MEPSLPIPSAGIGLSPPGVWLPGSMPFICDAMPPIGSGFTPCPPVCTVPMGTMPAVR